MDDKLKEAYAELLACTKALLSWRNRAHGEVQYIRDTDGSRRQLKLTADAVTLVESLEPPREAAQPMPQIPQEVFRYVKDVNEIAERITGANVCTEPTPTKGGEALGFCDNVWCMTGDRGPHAKKDYCLNWRPVAAAPPREDLEGIRQPDNNERGMPVYLEIHKGHRSGHLNFGIRTGLIAEFTVEQMNEFRQMCTVTIGLCEEAFRSGNEKRYPTASSASPNTDAAKEIK